MNRACFDCKFWLVELHLKESYNLDKRITDCTFYNNAPEGYEAYNNKLRYLA